MADNNRNSRDLAITEGRYALVLDRTKGHVETLTGPHKSSLADTQTPIIFSPDSKAGYYECDTPQDAVQAYVVAKQGQYAVLYNPSKENGSEKDFPPKGKGSSPSILDIGNVINITGPVSFALWWQQQAEVIDSHKLKSNQFLLVEVTNEDQAKANWKKAEIKPALAEDGSTVAVTKDPESIYSLDPNKFTLGQRIIVRGVEISSFIPPTGMRVVPDANKSYVREAATLESQQYCVLRSENGKKRYCQGPAVVFPTATETFIEENGNRIFRCIELNANSGIHVMVIADYTGPDGKLIKSGTELFITGKDTPIYYPRPEHAIIKYDTENFIHYATAVPEGEGRYVLDKDSGKVLLKRGPDMLLLNPTKEIFIRRVLSPTISELYYPGNVEATRVNRELTEKMSFANSEYLSYDNDAIACASVTRGFTTSTPKGRTMVSDVVQRKSSYTPPRSLTLDNKYSGAVTISIWPGYAVQVVKKSGKSRVEVGPKTVLLEYDESLTRLNLSTGKPKSTDRLQETVYLKVAGNQVTDIVNVETNDSINVSIKIALKVEFTGEPDNWFTVDNYVKESCDHVRSILRGTVKKLSILDFTKSATEIVRDAILGVKPVNEGRPGLKFETNGVHIHDVEVIDVKIADQMVAKMIQDSHQDTIRGMLEVLKKQQMSVVVKEVEAVERTIITERQMTEKSKYNADIETVGRKLELLTAELNLGTTRDIVIAKSKLDIQSLENQITEKVLEREKSTASAKSEINEQIQALEAKKLAVETAAIVDRLKAVDPQLVAAIEASNDRDALVKVTEQMGLSAYLKNDSIGAALSGILKGTSLETAVGKLGRALGNG
jgi:major vault protein